MDPPQLNTALECLDIFVGTWNLEAVFPSNPTEVVPGGRAVFEWMKGRQLLIERTEVSAAEFPDGLSIVAFDAAKGAYVQHYFDSRGIIRLYAMTFNNGIWTLLRTSPDSQRWTSRNATQARSPTTATPFVVHGRPPTMASTGERTST